MKSSMKFSDVAQKLGAVKATSLTEFPERDPDLVGIQAITAAATHTLSYIEGPSFASYLDSTLASALILPMEASFQVQANQRGIAWVSSDYPRLAFAQAIALFYRPFQLTPGIHPTAVIDPTAQVGEGAAIGAHVVIQAGACVGSGVCIHPNSVIYPEAQVGDRTVLHANCVIHERAQIGADCVIHSGAVIGSEGFGFVPTPDAWVKMEQAGVTVLEDGVEVGCNAAIDRPAVGETRIGRGTKIDNLVHIAHACSVDEQSVLAAQVGLAGNVKLGKRVVLAGQVGIANRVSVGAGATATAQTGVHRDVPAGEIVSGYPAIPNRRWLKISAIYNRLPEIYKAFRKL